MLCVSACLSALMNGLKTYYLYFYPRTRLENAQVCFCFLSGEFVIMNSAFIRKRVCVALQMSILISWLDGLTDC